MTESQPAELSLYQLDHREWRRQHASNIAAVLTSAVNDERLLDSWLMLRPETKESVWECLDKSVRERIKALCKARPRGNDS